MMRIGSGDWWLTVLVQGLIAGAAATLAAWFQVTIGRRAEYLREVQASARSLFHNVNALALENKDKDYAAYDSALALVVQDIQAIRHYARWPVRGRSEIRAATSAIEDALYLVHNKGKTFEMVRGTVKREMRRLWLGAYPVEGKLQASPPDDPDGENGS